MIGMRNKSLLIITYRQPLSLSAVLILACTAHCCLWTGRLLQLLMFATGWRVHYAAVGAMQVSVAKGC